MSTADRPENPRNVTNSFPAATLSNSSNGDHKGNTVEECDFIVIADIELKKGLESEFEKWFSESNKALMEFDGFISRKLLRSQNGNNYRIILTMDNKDSFLKMHRTQRHSDLNSKAVTFMTRPPLKIFYSVVSQ